MVLEHLVGSMTGWLWGPYMVSQVLTWDLSWKTPTQSQSSVVGGRAEGEAGEVAVGIPTWSHSHMTPVWTVGGITGQ